MARIAIEMPRLGYDMETGIVSGWLKKVGDSITRGEAIAEIVHDAGAEVAVGEPIAWLDEA